MNSNSHKKSPSLNSSFNSFEYFENSISNNDRSKTKYRIKSSIFNKKKTLKDLEIYTEDKSNTYNVNEGSTNLKELKILDNSEFKDKKKGK